MFRTAAFTLALISVSGYAYANKAVATGSTNQQSYGSSSPTVFDFGSTPALSQMGSSTSSTGSSNFSWKVSQNVATSISSSSAVGQAHAYAFAEVDPQMTSPADPGQPEPAPPVPEASTWVFLVSALASIGAATALKKRTAFN